MKISETLKSIDTEWIQKPKGFRVRFNIYKDDFWDVDTSPDEKSAPLDSDVTAWRLAWKLAQANQPAPPGFKDGDLVNITVVNDQDDPIRSYITNECEIYNPQEIAPILKTDEEKQ